VQKEKTMKNRILISTLLLTTLFAAGGSLAVAGPGFGRGGFGQDGKCGKTLEDSGERLVQRLAMLAEVLDLNEQQQGQINQLLTSHFEQSQNLRQQAQQNSADLRDQLYAKTFDEQGVRLLAEKQAGFKTELLVARAKLKQQIYQVLTPEQQEKAEKLRQLREAGGRGRRGMGFSSLSLGDETILQ
jgi:protein CpxP